MIQMKTVAIEYLSSWTRVYLNSVKPLILELSNGQI